MMSSINPHMKSRLRWKENKLLWPIWIAFAVLFLIGLGSITIMANLQSQMAASLMRSWYLLFGCVAGLAIGIVMFSPEREQETDLFLGRLPVPDSDVAQAKYLQAFLFFVGFLAFAGIATIVVFRLRFGGSLFDEATDNGGNIGLITSLLIPFQCFLWSLICSALFRNSLYATLAAAFASIVGVVVIATAVGVFSYGIPDRQLTLRSLVLYSCLTIGLVFGALRYSRTWLRGKFQLGVANQVEVSTDLETSRIESQRLVPSYPFRALAWQSIREHWVPVAISLAVMLITVIATYSLISRVFVEMRGGNISSRFAVDSIYYFFQMCLLLAGAIGVLIGLSTFSSDQTRNNFLFFQQQADYPRRIWIARNFLILLMVGPFFLMTCLLLGMAFHVHTLHELATAMTGYNNYGTVQDTAVKLVSSWRVTFVFIAVAGLSQLISILCRSGMLAFIVGCCFAVLICLWCGYVIWLNESLFLFAAPIVVACFAFSWWYAPQWVRGGRSLRGIGMACVVVGATSIACVAGLGWHRYHEIKMPVAGAMLGEDFARSSEKYVKQSELLKFYDNPEAMIDDHPERFKAAILLRDAAEKSVDISDIFGAGFKNSPWNGKKDFDMWPGTTFQEFIEANQETFAMVAEAVEDPRSRFFLNPNDQKLRQEQIQMLSLLTGAQTHHLLKQKDLNAARDAIRTQILASHFVGSCERVETSYAIGELIRWSEMAGQDAETLNSAIEMLNELRLKMFESESPVWRDERLFHSLRVFDEWAKDDASYPFFFPPWELERSKRVISQSLTSDTYRWRIFCESIRDYKTASLQNGQGLNPVGLNSVGRSANWDHTIAPYTPLLQTYLQTLSTMLYVQVRLALEAHFCEHGKYPENLSSLKFPVRMPESFSPGRAYAYSSTGMDLPVIIGDEQKLQLWNYRIPWNNDRIVQISQEYLIPKNTPYLLPWAGLAFQKRQFQIGLDLNARGYQQWSTDDPEVGYFIANPDRSYATGHYLMTTREYVLKRKAK